MPFGIADVHPGQVGGEQRRLLAALAGFHLQHDVVGVVRIARCQHVGELVVEFGDLGLEFGDLGGERWVVCSEFAGGIQITAGRLQLAVGGRDRCQLCEPFAYPARIDGITVQVRIG